MKSCSCQALQRQIKPSKSYQGEWSLLLHCFCCMESRVSSNSITFSDHRFLQFITARLLFKPQELVSRPKRHNYFMGRRQNLSLSVFRYILINLYTSHNIRTRCSDSLIYIIGKHDWSIQWRYIGFTNIFHIPLNKNEAKLSLIQVMSSHAGDVI